MAKKESKFSWVHKDMTEKESTSNDENSDAGKEDDFMQFSNGGAALDETKKAGHDYLTESTAKLAATPYLPQKEGSFITKDMVINGSITAENSIVIDGMVNGNITTDSDITVNGKVEGNISADNVKITGAKLKGDIACKSSISFVKDSCVEGNVSGKNVEINGTINGSLTADESAVIMNSAVINGDIIAGLISVMEGAEIKGNVQVNKLHKVAEEKSTETVPAKDTKKEPTIEAEAASAKAEGDPLLKRYI
jgi:cytoskeletal protein CcmA (bactofilin family)